jgi:ATP synthase F1 gamma subunit
MYQLVTFFMLSLKNIVDEIEQTMEIKSIVTAYEEIASLKMRRIRENVVSNRDLIIELSDIYRQILTSYKNQIVELMNKKKIKNNAALSVREHNNKTACIFISADSGLFGSILKKTYQEFADYIQKNDVEPVIMGGFGRKRFMAQFPTREFIYFPIGEKDDREGMGKKISETLLAFTNIIIFYPKFESMASQKVALLDVSGQQQALANEGSTQAYYFFEPSLEKIIDFFEKEIFSSILGQTVVESRLARYASRMLMLDMSTQNIDTRLKEIGLEKNIILHRNLNKKQIGALTGMMLWKLA